MNTIAKLRLFFGCAVCVVRRFNIAPTRAYVFILLATFCFNVSALDKNGNFESVREQDEFIVKLLKNIAAEINTQTPIKFGEDTLLISVVALQKTMTYYMRLTDVKFSDIDSNMLLEIEQIAREHLNHTACQTKAAQHMIDLGVEYAHLYSDSDGKQIARVSIKNYSC